MKILTINASHRGQTRFLVNLLLEGAREGAPSGAPEGGAEVEVASLANLKINRWPISEAYLESIL